MLLCENVGLSVESLWVSGKDKASWDIGLLSLLCREWSMPFGSNGTETPMTKWLSPLLERLRVVLIQRFILTNRHTQAFTQSAFPLLWIICNYLIMILVWLFLILSFFENYSGLFCGHRGIILPLQCLTLLCHGMPPCNPPYTVLDSCAKGLESILTLEWLVT